MIGFLKAPRVPPPTPAATGGLGRYLANSTRPGHSTSLSLAGKYSGHLVLFGGSKPTVTGRHWCGFGFLVFFYKRL